MKKIIYPILSLLVLAGCSKNEINTGIDDDSVEIKLKPSVGQIDAETTRGEGMKNSTSFPLNKASFVLAHATGGTAGTGNSTWTGAAFGVALEISFANSSTATSFSPPEHYLSTGKETKVIGWHPGTTATGVSSTYSSLTREVGFAAIDGETDIMATELRTGNKAVGSRITTTEFKHLLTQISVQAYATTQGEADAWGGIESIEVIDKKQSISFTLPDPSGAGTTYTNFVAGNVKSNLPIVKKNPADNSQIDGGTAGTVWSAANRFAVGIGATSAAAKLAGYAMFAPEIGPNSYITLRVVTEKNTTGQNVKVNAPTFNSITGFQAGYKYAVTLKLTGAVIEPIVTIADWTTGDPVEVEM